MNELGGHIYSPSSFFAVVFNIFTCKPKAFPQTYKYNQESRNRSTCKKHLLFEFKVYWIIPTSTFCEHGARI